MIYWFKPSYRNRFESDLNQINELKSTNHDLLINQNQDQISDLNSLDFNQQPWSETAHYFRNIGLS